jgi:hypothetical protein
METKTYTHGNVIVEDIEIGDIHYEYEHNIGIKSKVITKPELSECGKYWSWQNENLNTGKLIDYGVNIEHSHYGPNLYDYEAYKVKFYI